MSQQLLMSDFHTPNMVMLEEYQTLAKKTVMDDFLTFVDQNSKQNGRSADSMGPTHYFVPKSTTIQAPKPGTRHYEEHLSRSVVIHSQRNCSKGTCSNGSSHNWLDQSIQYATDYCDTERKD